MEPAIPIIDKIVVLDPPGGVLDRYIESFQLEHLNLSRQISRSDDLLANAAAVARLQQSCPENEYVLRLATMRRGPVPVRELADHSAGCGQTLVFAREYQRSSWDSVKVQGIPPAVTDSEFDLKVGGHLSRLVRLQPAGSPMNPPSLPFPDISRQYSGFNEFSVVLDERHTVSIDLEGVTYDYFSDLKTGSRHLVVFGQSAIGGRRTVQLPVFHRWKWMSDLDTATSAIALNDPTLYRDEAIDGGWWVGTRERDYVLEAVAIIRKILERLHLSPQDVVFYGGSAGGFSSFQMAACLPGSRVMADIPQIDLRKYQHRKAIDDAVRAGLGFASVDEVPHQLLHRIDVIERFMQQEHVPEFLYIQNIRDTSHVGAHFEDFKARLSALASEHAWARTKGKYETYSAWSVLRGGHFPLNRFDTMRYLNGFLAGSSDRG